MAGREVESNNDLPFPGRRQRKHGGVKFPRHGAFCLETQNFPDAVNQPQFPKSVRRPGETYDTTTVFRFASR